MRNGQTAVDPVAETLRFTEQHYVERDREDEIIEEILQKWHESSVIILRGRKGEGKSWFLLYWLAKAPKEGAQEKQAEPKDTVARWVGFLQGHEVFALLCESLPIDDRFFKALKQSGIHVFYVKKDQNFHRLTESEIRDQLAEQMRDALNLSRVIPLPKPEAETQFQLAYRNMLEERARHRKPLFIVDSIDVLEPNAREALLSLYLYPILDAGGRLLLTMRVGSRPPFKRKALSEAPEVELPRLDEDMEQWKRWIKRWVSKRLGQDAEAPENVWECLAQRTQGYPFLMALAWGCARAASSDEHPQSIWAQLQEQAQEKQEEEPCPGLRQCMGRWWIRLTFAPYAENGDFSIPDPYTNTKQRLTEEELRKILEGLCAAADGQKIEIFSWKPPIEKMSQWTVLAMFNAQGLLTWKDDGFYLDDVIPLLFGTKHRPPSADD